MDNEELDVIVNDDESVSLLPSEETTSQDSYEAVEVVNQEDLNLSESAGIGMMSVGVACMLSLGINQVLKMFRRA